MHDDDVVSMAIHPDGEIIATGQMASKDLIGEASNKRGAAGRKALAEGKLVRIYIWNSKTMELIKEIVGFHRRALRHLKFSPSGKYLMSIGEDDKNSVAIYDWQQGNKGAMLANSQTS
jgi:echinoderm microtubule-associated protein-like 6